MTSAIYDFYRSTAQRLPWWLSLPAMQETQVQSLGRENPLEKETATHSSILAWRIPWTEEPGGLHSMGLQRVDMTEQLSMHACTVRTTLYPYIKIYILRTHTFMSITYSNNKTSS